MGILCKQHNSHKLNNLNDLVILDLRLPNRTKYNKLYTNGYKKKYMYFFFNTYMRHKKLNVMYIN